MKKNKIALSKRLEYISDLVSHKRICDVACDHGKLVAKLFLENKIEYAIVSDISEKCANKAKDLLSSLEVKNFDMRVGDGFSNIIESDRLDEAIISGLGGNEIIKILENNSINFKSIILQPQNHEIDLKKYILSNGYKIDFDIIIQDKKYYNIFKISKGEGETSDLYIYFGKDNFDENNKLEFLKYLNYYQEKICKYIDKLSGEKLLENKKILGYIEKAKKILGE